MDGLLMHILIRLYFPCMQSILDVVLSNEPSEEGGSFDPSDADQEVEIDLDKLRPETLLAIQNHLGRLSALAGPRWPGGPPLKAAPLLSSRSMPSHRASVDNLQHAAPDKLPTIGRGGGSLRLAAAAAAAAAATASSSEAPEKTPTGQAGHFLRHHVQPHASAATASGIISGGSAAVSHPPLSSPRASGAPAMAVHSVGVQQPVPHTAAAVIVAQVRRHFLASRPVPILSISILGENDVPFPSHPLCSYSGGAPSSDRTAAPKYVLSLVQPNRARGGACSQSTCHGRRADDDVKQRKGGGAIDLIARAVKCGGCLRSAILFGGISAARCSRPARAPSSSHASPSLSNS